MVALAFMSMESSYLIRAALGKSLWESACSSTSQEWPAYRRRREKVDIFLEVVDPYHGCVNLTSGWLCLVFSRGLDIVPVQYEGNSEDDLRWEVASQTSWPLWISLSPPKVQRLLIMCVLYQQTLHQCDWLWKSVIKGKMPPTESLLAITGIQSPRCPEWKWLTWLGPGGARPCIQSH